MTNLQVNQRVRLSKAWAKKNGRRQYEGHFLHYEEGDFARVRLEEGTLMRVPKEDVEPYDPKPEEMVWLGDLSGWYIETKPVAFERDAELPYLSHRCGKSFVLDGDWNFLANLIQDHIKPHICK